jgi:carboxylate-amine ligase
VDHAFGRAEPFALGIEEELLLVDPVTFELVHESSDLLRVVEAPVGQLAHDVYEAMVECITPIVAGAAEGAEVLSRQRDTLRAAGATLIGSGLHPTGAFGDVVHVPAERYQSIDETMRGLLRRTPTAALHVHVGMPDPETAIAVCNRMRAYLPLLQGLAANSPFWHGYDSGFASARAMTFRAFPRSIIPPAFADWAHYVEMIRWWEEVGDLPDYTFLWWDLRPSPKHGTIEVRAMDAQGRLASVAGLAALVHALARACADGADEPAPPSEVLMESSFRAGRDGIHATTWWRGRLRPLRETGADTLALARSYAGELDGADALEEIERILRDGGGADRMRKAHAAGGMGEVLARLAAEATEPYGSTQTTSPSRSQL